jgi:hypothetical protein
MSIESFEAAHDVLKLIKRRCEKIETLKEILSHRTDDTNYYYQVIERQLLDTIKDIISGKEDIITFLNKQCNSL